MNKLITGLIGIGVFLIGTFAVCMQFAHCNDVDKIQIIQNINGSMEVRRSGGWYFRTCPRIWEYPKACSYYFSNKSSQSKDHDAPSVRYSNTGKGDINCQVVYRIDWATDEELIKMHEIAHGDDVVLEQRVLSTLNNIAQAAASKITSTDAIKKYDEFFMTIRSQMIHNKELMDTMSIDVVDFVIAGEPEFDDKTKQLFSAQQEADLLKQTAEAEKIRLISEKERAIAQYEKESAENEGKAKAQLAKDRTDAEREATVAKINAEREKSVAETDAAKRKSVAELQRQTEEENLKIQQLVAEQKIVAANAKQKEIELTKAITEVERAKLDLELGIAKAKWESIGKALSNMKLPQIINFGGNGDVRQNPLDNLINMMTIEKINATDVQSKK